MYVQNCIQNQIGQIKAPFYGVLFFCPEKGHATYRKAWPFCITKFKGGSQIEEKNKQVSWNSRQTKPPQVPGSENRLLQFPCRNGVPGVYAAGVCRNGCVDKGKRDHAGRV